MTVEQDNITYTCGYQFKNNSYVQSDQYMQYRKAVDEIHLMAIQVLNKDMRPAAH